MRRLVVLQPSAAVLVTPEGWASVLAAVTHHREEDDRVLVVAPPLAGGPGAIDHILVEAVSARHERPLTAWGAAHREAGVVLGVDGAAVLAAEAGELARHALSTSVMAGVRPATHARARALGPLASAHLLAEALSLAVGPATLLDVLPLVRTRPGQGADHYLRARPVLPRRDPDALGEAPILVAPGGIGSSLGSGPTPELVMVAGGAPVTTAVLAVIGRAARVEIHGAPPLHTARPAWTRGARPVAELAPAEARELAALGWEGLHADAVGLLASEGIEVVLAGPAPTRIAAEVDPVDGARLVHVSEGLHALSLDPDGPTDAALASVLSLIEEHGGRLSRLVAGTTNLTAVLAGEPDSALVDELEGLGRVAVLPECTAVTLVGSGMRSLWHQVGPALEAVGRPRLRLVAEGSDDRTLVLVIDAAVAEPVVRALHSRLFTG